ncbi:MAG: hypothetical protein Q8P15_00340 [Nanoarchaeota archaeon]|nr:hypothetical protein [Nanoarchaeota archaeon]
MANYPSRKFLVKNLKEFQKLERKISKFDRKYSIIGEGRIILELGKQKNMKPNAVNELPTCIAQKEMEVNIYPKDEQSNIEMIVSEENESGIKHTFSDRQNVCYILIGKTEYWISNNPNHYLR